MLKLVINRLSCSQLAGEQSSRSSTKNVKPEHFVMVQISLVIYQFPSLIQSNVPSENQISPLYKKCCPSQGTRSGLVALSLRHWRGRNLTSQIISWVEVGVGELRLFQKFITAKRRPVFRVEQEEWVGCGALGSERDYQGCW